MEKILLIIQREYIQRVRTRWFLISTILTPFVLLGISALPILATPAGRSGNHAIVVLDQSGDPALFAAIKQKMADSRQAFQEVTGQVDPIALNLVMTNFELSQVIVTPGENIDQMRQAYNADIQNNSLSGYIVLRPEVLNNAEPEYYARNVSDLSLSQLGTSIGKAIIERRLVRAGLDPARATEYLRTVELKLIKVEGGSETRSGGENILLPLLMYFSMFGTIYFYGISVMHGVIEEKQSRIVEVMLSSVKPFTMMIGKIVGIGLVGLTQYVIWILSVVLLTKLNFSLIGGAVRFTSLPASMLLWFIIYFVLGYFLYATVYAIIGSVVSRQQDAHQLQYPVSLMIAGPGLMFWYVMRDPSGPQTTALSLFPFFAPTLMMLRLGVVTPPLWQILLSILLMVITIAAGIWLAAKIYRVGILMYGKRPTLIEVGRWLRHS